MTRLFHAGADTTGTLPARYCPATRAHARAAFASRPAHSTCTLACAQRLHPGLHTPSASTLAHILRSNLHRGLSTSSASRLAHSTCSQACTPWRRYVNCKPDEPPTYVFGSLPPILSLKKRCPCRCSTEFQMYVPPPKINLTLSSIFKKARLARGSWYIRSRM